MDGLLILGLGWNFLWTFKEKWTLIRNKQCIFLKQIKYLLIKSPIPKDCFIATWARDLKSLTGEYSKLQPHHNISLSQNKLSGAVEIFMAVFFEKFMGKFFYEHTAIKISTVSKTMFWLKEIFW